jgi:hypothetical protein
MATYCVSCLHFTLIRWDGRYHAAMTNILHGSCIRVQQYNGWYKIKPEMKLKLKLKLKLIYDRQSVGQCVLVPGTHLGPVTNFFSLFEIFFRRLLVCYFVAPSLTRVRVCNLLYNCFWALPEQARLGRSPAELTAMFYCLIWDCVPSSSPLTTRWDYGGGILTRLHTG